MEVIIITGASDGLGKAFAEIAVKNGIKIVNISRRKCEISGVDNIACDLTNKADIDNAVKVINQNHSKFKALINNAGIPGRQKLNAVSYDEMENIFKVNTFAPIYLTSKLIDLIKENEADIVNISSTAGTKAYKDEAAYGSSKWALRGFSLNLQLELKDTKCRVIQFNPGGMASSFFIKHGLEVQENLSEWMLPTDVAAVLWNTLQNPKQVEISEITINRKGQRGR